VSIDARHVLPGREPASREEAVRIIGEFMIASGEATPYHLDGRLEKEPRHGTWITEDVALSGRVKISERLGKRGFSMMICSTLDG